MDYTSYIGVEYVLRELCIVFRKGGFIKDLRIGERHYMSVEGLRDPKESRSPLNILRINAKYYNKTLRH